MALDMFTQVMHMKSADKSIAAQDTQSLKKNAQASDRDNNTVADKDRPQFGEVLEKIQNEQNDKPVQKNDSSVKKEDVRGRLEDIQARVAMMKDDNSAISVEVLDKIQALLKLIKTALEARFAEENSAMKGAAESDPGSKAELLNSLKELLAKLNKLIESKTEPSEMLEALDKLELELATLLPQNVNKKPETQVSRNDIRLEADTSNIDKAGNVKVIDLRGREPVEADIASVTELKSMKETLPKEKNISNEKSGMADKTPHTRTEKNEMPQTAKFALENPEVKNGRVSEPAPFVRHYQNFANPVSRANLDSIMQGVTGKAIVVLQEGRSEMKLNLVPPELGKMHMKFELENGELIGKIVVSTPEAKMLFDQNLGDLQKNLRDAGVNVTSLDVSLGQEQSGGGEKEAGAAQNGGILTDELALEEEWNALSLYDSSVNLIA